MRIPLAVPLPVVGGSRPVTPQGLQLLTEFGDGVWGQEQERVEIVSVGIGFSLRDRFEFNVSGYEPTRNDPENASTIGVRGKIRLGDFMEGGASAGIHVAHMTAERQLFGVQDERMTAWDLALPLTFYPVGGQVMDHRWSVYVAPRLVFQTFEDRMTRETTNGTLAAALLGVAARWPYFALTGEINLAHTPSMSLGNTPFQGGWILLPMVSGNVILPIGD
jgi:hypothetical protein